MKASDLFEKARQLDQADRAINAYAALKCAKAGDIEQAYDTMGIFVKNCGYDVSVHDNQTLWWEHECAQSHLKKKEYR